MTLTLRRWLGMAAMLAVAGVAAWSLIGVPGIEKPLPGRLRETGNLPQVVRPQTKKALEILGKSAPWGKLADPGAAGESAIPTWRLVGVISVGKERVALIQLAGQPEQQLKAGDVLPGGGRILAVMEDSLTVRVDGAERTIEVIQQEMQTL